MMTYDKEFAKRYCEDILARIEKLSSEIKVAIAIAV